MPQAYVKKLAKKKGINIQKAESKWSQATKIASETGREENYAYITGIFKNLMNEDTTIANLSTFNSMRIASGLSLMEEKILSDDEIHMWNVYISGISKIEIQKWLELDVSPDEAREFNEVGIKFNEAKKWIQSGFTGIDANVWVNYGFNLDDAIYYENNLHMTPTEALDYLSSKTNKEYKICFYKDKETYEQIK